MSPPRQIEGGHNTFCPPLDFQIGSVFLILTGEVSNRKSRILQLVFPLQFDYIRNPDEQIYHNSWIVVTTSSRINWIQFRAFICFGFSLCVMLNGLRLSVSVSPILLLLSPAFASLNCGDENTKKIEIDNN